MNITTQQQRTSFTLKVSEGTATIEEDISRYSKEKGYFVDVDYYDNFFDVIYYIARWNVDDIELVLADLIKKNLDSTAIEALITNLK